MAITLTEKAQMHVRNYLADHSDSVGLRLAVKVAGCSGFTYVVEPALAVSDDDSVFEENGCRVVVDAKALPFLDGMILDYVQAGLNKRFSFQNPNVAGACGCGESFTVEAEVDEA